MDWNACSILLMVIGKSLGGVPRASHDHSAACQIFWMLMGQVQVAAFRICKECVQQAGAASAPKMHRAFNVAVQ